MRVHEIKIAEDEFYEFIKNLFPEAKETGVMITACDMSNNELKFKYEEEDKYPGIYVTSYKRDGSWDDIKVHIKPRVSPEYTIKKEEL